MLVPPQMGMDVLHALLSPTHPQAVGSPLIGCPADTLLRDKFGPHLFPTLLQLHSLALHDQLEPSRTFAEMILLWRMSLVMAFYKCPGDCCLLVYSASFMVGV